MSTHGYKYIFEQINKWREETSLLYRRITNKICVILAFVIFKCSIFFLNILRLTWRKICKENKISKFQSSIKYNKKVDHEQQKRILTK